jgi:hypothetical protein
MVVEKDHSLIAGGSLVAGMIGVTASAQAVTLFEFCDPCVRLSQDTIFVLCFLFSSCAQVLPPHIYSIVFTKFHFYECISNFHPFALPYNLWYSETEFLEAKRCVANLVDLFFLRFCFPGDLDQVCSYSLFFFFWAARHRTPAST